MTTRRISKVVAGLVFVTALAGGLSSTTALAGTIDPPKDGLPPDLGVGEVQLTLVIRNIGDPDHQKLMADGNKVGHIKIIMPAVDSNRVAISETTTTETMPFYLLFWQDPTFEQEAGSTTTWVHTYYVTIKEKVPGKLAEKYANASMEIKVTLLDGTTEEKSLAGETSFTLTREIFAIKEAPAFQDPAIAGSHQQIRAFWTHRKDVTAQGATTTKEPKRTNVYVVERASDTNPTAPATLTLPGKKFSPTTGATADVVSCTYTAPAGTEGDCVVCPESVYLDATAIAAGVANGTIVGMKKPKVANSSDEGATVPGLDNAKSYFVFLQWEPGGLATSKCVVGQPSINITFTELNGEDPAEVVDFRCFIATAAYGTPLHRDIRLFRSFRDDVLKQSPAGRALVATYYRVSPTIADFIAARPTLKAWVRARLETIARQLKTAGEKS